MSLGPVTGLTPSSRTTSVDDTQNADANNPASSSTSPSTSEKPTVASDVQNAARAAAQGAENAIKGLFGSGDDLKGVLLAGGGVKHPCGPRGGRCS